MKKNKKILIIILILLLIIITPIYYKNKSKIENNIISKEDINNELVDNIILNKENQIIKQKDIVEEEKDNFSWKVTQRQDNQAFYKDTWKAVPMVKGYQFILKSGNVIVWGEDDAFCKDKKDFIYGVSYSSCVNFVYAFLKVADPSKSLSGQDLNDFGDFVLKNK